MNTIGALTSMPSREPGPVVSGVHGEKSAS